MRKGWTVETLSEVCQIKPPKRQVKETLSPSDLVSFVPMSNLRVRSRDLQLNEERPLAKVISSYTYFANNDVLLAKITPCFENGKLGIARNLKNGVGFGSSEYIVFRSKGRIDPEYLFYFLSQDSFRDAGAGVMTGAVGHKRISKEFIENFKIPLPPLAEQKRIVAALDETFEGIDLALSAANKNLVNARELFKTTLNTTFTHKGEGWVETALGKVCENLDSKRIPITKSKRLSGNIPYYGASGIVDHVANYIFDEDLLLVSEDGANLLARTYPIAFGISGKTWVNNHAHALRFDQISSQKFMEYYLNSISLKPFVSGMAQPKLNQKMLNSIPVPWPSIKIQDHIVNKLNLLSEQTQHLEALYQQKIDALTELKQSLLQKAFAGELTDSNVIQSAEVADTQSSEFAANVIAFNFRQHEKVQQGKTYGRVKAQKGLHLVESIGGVDMARVPFKDAAGPNDSGHARTAENWAKANQFFEFVKRPDGLGYDFVKLSKYDALLTQAETRLAEFSDDISKAIKPLVHKRTETAEVFTTVHAAWNNLIIDGEEITDEAIVTEAREDWHADKMNISRHKFFEAIDDIRQRGLEPTGTGKRVGEKQERLF